MKVLKMKDNSKKQKSKREKKSKEANIKKNRVTLGDRIVNNCTFTAIRLGMISVMPLMVIGSFALMFMSLPIPIYQKFINGLFGGIIVEILDFVYSGIFGFFAVILAVSTSVNYAMAKQKQRKESIHMGDIIVLTLITIAALAGTLGIQYENFDVEQFGNLNTFIALFVALVSSKLYFAIKKTQWFRFREKGTLNDNVYTSAIEGIVPAIIIIGLFIAIRWLFIGVFSVDTIQALLEKWANELVMAVDHNFGEGLAVLLLTHIMWLFGIHGNNVLDPIVEQNFVQISGDIFNKTFQDTFVIIGGCGTVLSLIIAILLFARKQNVKNIAKLATSSVIFNISEIVVFGLPVILNPVFIVPFICLPIFNYVVAYGAMYFELVPKVVNEVEWTTPIILNAYQATGSWRAIVLQLFCIGVGVIVYKPFVALFEKQSDKRFAQDVKLLVEALQRDEDENRVVMYTEQQDSLGNIARMLAMDLEEAISRQQLFLMYQPQVNAKEVCVGAEALLRWDHPIAGFIYPPLIIQLAREMNILHRVEEFIMDRACSAIKRIEHEIDSDFKISINLTNGSLEWDGFENALAKAVEKYNVPNNKLWLEITERDAISSSIDTIEKIKSIKNKGHKFLIDDFGMGHTSLLYLQTNQFDVLKLDGILTRDILENKRNSEIIASIAHLSKSLKFDIIAEYVGTREQRDELAEIGCYAFQGNLYSKPLFLDDLVVWMKEHTEETYNEDVSDI